MASFCAFTDAAVQAMVGNPSSLVHGVGALQVRGSKIIVNMIIFKYEITKGVSPMSFSSSTPQPGEVMPLLVSRRDAAKLLGLCMRSIDLLSKDGRLPSVLIGDRRLFRTADIARFAETGTPENIRKH